MFNGEKKNENIKELTIFEEQKNTINDYISENNPLIIENITQSSFNILDLFNLLSASLKYNNSNENIYAILTEINKKIDIGINTSIPSNSFEPFILILDKCSNYSAFIIESVLRIIYMLITISSEKMNEYFHFFSQPIFLDYYFNLFVLNSYSIRIITEIIRKKTQILDAYAELISFKISQAPPSESLINLLIRCFKINPQFISIDQLSVKLDAILRLNLDESLVCSTADFVRQIIKKYEIAVSFFATNSIYYLKPNNDDIDNAFILKIYIEIVKITKDFSFLFIGANEIFVNYLLFILKNSESKDFIISTLFELLSCDANISCFLNFPQVMIASIQKIETFPYKEQKKLMYFLTNFIIHGNKKLLEIAIKAGILGTLSIFMENCTDTKLTLRMLKIVGIICENQMFISNQHDIFQCVETLTNSENEEVASLASAVFQKIN